MQRHLGMLGEGDGYWGATAAAARRTLDTPLAPLVARRLDPATPAAGVTLIRADNDLIVGSEPVTQLAAAWGAELVTYGAGHLTVMNMPGIATRIRSAALRVRAPAERDLQQAG